MMESWNQFLMMMYKGFLLRKRHFIVTGFEILLPILVASIPVIIAAQMPPGVDMTNPHASTRKFHNATFFDSFSPFAGDWYPQVIDVLYTPNNTKATKLLKTAEIMFKNTFPNAHLSLIPTNSESELEAVAFNLQVSKYNPVVGIVLKNFHDASSELPKTLDYKIRCTSYGPNSFYLNYKYSSQIGANYLDPYRDFFLPWQASVEQAFIAEKSNKSEKSGNFKVMMQRFPYPEYYTEPQGSMAIEVLSMIVVYGFTIFFIIMVKRVMVEKMNHSKELLKMMGMNNIVYWSSTFLNSFILVVFISIIINIMYTVKLSNGASIFSHVDFGLLLVLFMLYFAASILFYLCLTTLLNKTNLVICLVIIVHVLSHILIFTFYLLPGINNASFTDLSFSKKMAICLLPNAAIQIAFKIIAVLESSKTGNAWGNISTVSSFIDLNLGDVMGMMFASCIIYSFLLWYLDNVWPWQPGVPKPFYFLFTKTYWCGSPNVKTEEDENLTSNEYYEKCPDDITPGIAIRNLSKTFKSGLVKKKALDNVSLNIYHGQITALLGRNGAGKTTTINILTGLFLPSSGSATINGYDVRTQTQKARASLGICPQHSILYETLTVEEHLKIYAVLKGVHWRDLSGEVSKTMKIIKLDEKRDELSQSLSGGMKRKLSLGIALIGDSKVLFLDEPTSGMDPEARRALWDILLDLRTDRTIVLTTHYMEEADILGDRIAFMANGKLHSCGTPMFLKKTFGTGYHINVEVQPDFDSSSILQFLMGYFPQATLKSSQGDHMLTYSLGADASGSVLGTMFQTLEEKKEAFGIRSFGVSVTTMDDVFLKVSLLADESVNKEKYNHHVETNSNGYNEGSFSLTYKKLESTNLYLHQIYGLLLKRFHYAKRQWLFLIFQILAPVALMCGFLYTVKSIFSPSAPNPLELNLASVYGNTMGVYKFDQAPDFERKFINVLKKNDVSEKSSKNFSKYALDLGRRDISLFRRSLSVGGENIENLNVTSWYNGEPYHILPMALTLMHEALLRFFTGDDSASIFLTNAPLPSNTNTSPNDIMVHVIPIITSSFIPLIVAYWTACYIILPIQECVSRAKLLQLMTGISSFTYWLTMLCWDMLMHIIVIFFLMIPLGVFTGSVFFAHAKSMGGFLILLILFGWSTLPICYLLSRVISKPATGFSLMASFTILTGLMIGQIIATLEKIPELTTKINFEALLCFLRLLPSFAVTRGFSKLMGVSYGNSVCDSIPENFLNLQCNVPSPNPNIIKCCKNICKDNCFQPINPMTWDSVGCGREIFFLFIDGIIYFALLFLFESGLPGKFFSQIWAKLPWKKKGVAATLIESGLSAERDTDVQHEEERIHHLDAMGMMDEALIVKELTKWYGGFCAVDSLTFGVHKEECFGLLGVNGAGKTSTFKMLTGDIHPTKGDALIHQTSVQTNLKKFQSYIGYCPQFDALIERLTGREMLYLFARLRGIPSAVIAMHVNHMINSVDLNECADRETRFYSGGNKRKLSLALSLIGTPPIIFLDEPTSGVDPVSRRKIWKVLEEARKIIKSAVILCTHSMEECEALSSRLAIMVNGQFRCLGSIQHLKNKYGLGYTVIIKLRREQCVDTQIKSNIMNNFQNTFPSASLKDDHQGMLHFHVTDAAVCWSYLFNSVEQMKQDFLFEDYLISGTTLEQIFLMFARAQNVTAQ